MMKTKVFCLVCGRIEDDGVFEFQIDFVLGYNGIVMVKIMRKWNGISILYSVNGKIIHEYWKLRVENKG